MVSTICLWRAFIFVVDMINLGCLLVREKFANLSGVSGGTFVSVCKFCMGSTVHWTVALGSRR